MKNIIAVLLSLAAFNTWAVNPMENYVHNDQIYNIPSRLVDDIMLNDYDRAWKPFFWISLPMDQVKILSANISDEAHLSAAFRLEGDTAWIPAYVNEKGKQIYHPESARAEGEITRLLGRRTMVSRDQNQFNILKFSPSMSDRENQFGTHSVQVTRYLRQLFNDYGEAQSFAIIEEPLSITFKGGGNFNASGDSYSIVVRSTKEFDRAFNQGFQVESAHALFGCKTCLEEVAAKKNLSTSDWIKTEYIPKYAKILAEAHTRYGLIFESHTQNILVVIDQEGTIQRFLYRDLAGIVIDPTKPLSRGSKFLAGLLNFRSVNKLFTSFSVPEKIYARDFGMHFSMYGVQSLDQIFDASYRFEFAKIFLHSYRQEVERQLGSTLQLSAQAEKDWAQFFSNLNGKNLPIKWSKRGNFRDSIAYLMEEIYTQVQQQRLTKMSERISKSPTEKLIAISEMDYDYKLKDLVYVSTEARQKVEKHFDFSITKLWKKEAPALSVHVHNGVKYITDENRQVLAYSLSFFDSQKSCLNVFHLNQ